MQLNWFRWKIITRVMLLLAMILPMGGGCPVRANQPVPHTILFYSAETNINNYRSLKMEFDRYLSAFGPFYLQPFSEREIFEAQLNRNGINIVLISSWHYSKIYKSYSLRPVLVGVRNGKTSGKRILVTRTQNKGHALANLPPLASASNIRNTRSVLNEMFPGDEAANSIRILPVPKDVDALYSLAFHVAKTAVVTEHALDNFKRLDPVLHSELTVLKEASESMLLILAMSGTDNHDLDRLIRIIREMPESTHGMNILKMFDLDGWENVGPFEKSDLEHRDEK